MKNNGKLFIIICVIINVLFITACNQIRREQKYIPARVSLSNEFIGIVSPPRNRTLKNFTILTDNTEKRVVLFSSELSQNRIIVLPKGKYEFRADGIQGKAFDLSDDCKIVSNGRTFTQEPLPPPPTISFRGSRWDMLGPLAEGTSYYLTILDLDNLNEPAGSYKATISGKGDIPLSVNKENNRIISESPYSFTRGTYTVNVSLHNTPLSSPRTFRVDPRPPFTLTINNTWQGRKLKYANIIAYKAMASTVSPGAVISRGDYTAFHYPYSNRNNSNVFETNTGSTGRLTVREVNDGDRIILVAMGVKTGDDDVYTYTIQSADRSRQEMTVSWQSIPSKGRNFVVNVPVHSSAQNSWELIDNFSVSFYYQLGDKPVPSQIALGGNGFTRINGIHYSRETDNSIMGIVDLSSVSMVSHINYLLRVDDEKWGAFYSNNTSSDMDDPQPLRKQE
jgi:hypothetical protein